VLTDDELRLVIFAARRDGFPFAFIVEMLALTGQRREETARMGWAQVDFKDAVWTIPLDDGEAPAGERHAATVDAADFLARRGRDITHSRLLGDLGCGSCEFASLQYGEEIAGVDDPALILARKSLRDEPLPATIECGLDVRSKA